MAFGAPMRALARRLSASLPQASHEGLQLLVGDRDLAQNAETLFERTIDALNYAAAHAPSSYDKLRKDVRTVVLRGETTSPPYNRFQLTLLVPAQVALEADAPAYAAWLLYASGLSRGADEAAARSSPIERTLGPVERDRLQALLPQVDG
jgi:hypothetical protein